MFWNNSNSGYYVPTPGNSNVADFQNFTPKIKDYSSKQYIKNVFFFLKFKI